MPFSNEYFQLFEDAPAFHERIEGKYKLDSGGGRISERLLRCIWYDRLYDEGKLTTCDGRKIVVHSPGTWNLEGGPDFRRAEISIGNVRLKGDVEAHIDPAGWRLHHHGGDPEYDNVILHVTLMPHRKKPNARDLPATRHGVEIAEVALWDILGDDLKLLKCALRPDEYPYGSTQNFGKCQGLLEQLSPETSQKLLCIAGDARMIAKQRRFGYESEERDLDQVAYGAVLEGMGYKAHTKQFALLAQRLPYARLRGQARSIGQVDDFAGGVRLTQALLLGAAALLPPPESDDPPEVREYLSNALALWREHGAPEPKGDEFEWRRAAVRPANLPERRLAGAGHVVSRTYEVGFFDSIMARALKADRKEARRECVDLLTAPEDEFWSFRYSARGKKLAAPVSLLGQSRAMTIIVNSFVPLGLLHARKRERRDVEELVFQFYCGLPSLPPNNVTRLMEFKMFGNSPKKRAARSARTQQGLLQIFADWCSEDPSCRNCGIFAGLQSGYIRDKVANIHT